MKSQRLRLAFFVALTATGHLLRHILTVGPAVRKFAPDGDEAITTSFQPNATVKTLEESGLDPRSSVGATTERKTLQGNATTLHPPVAQDAYFNRTITLIVNLRGEMCNQLSVLAAAKITQRFVEKRIPGIRVEMIGDHQHSTKGVVQKRNLPRCFPNLKQFEFAGGTHDPLFQPIAEQQSKWLQRNASMLNNIFEERQVEYLKSLLDSQARRDPNVPPPLPTGSKYSLPYLSVSRFASYEILNSDETYDDIRSYLRFDSRACCRERAEPDETVFHFRNFVTEILKASIRKEHNFEEFSPNETADVLFHNNYTGDIPKKIAIISREALTAEPYVAALRSRGWEARIIRGQSGSNDFCLAMSASRLVGVTSSTYVRWAGLLGNATSVRWYSVRDTTTQQKTLHEREKRVFRGREFWFETHSRSESLTQDTLSRNNERIKHHFDTLNQGRLAVMRKEMTAIRNRAGK